MSKATFFVQECPTCGRRLQVRVQYLGRHLVCQHCGGEFHAADPEGEPLGAEAGLQGLALMQRADELLASAAEQRRRPR